MAEAGRSNSLYGQGSYFAVKARYSHHYAHRLRSADGRHWHRQLLLVNVLCGVRKEYAGSAIDKSFGRVKLVACGCDSVRGGPHQPTRAGPGDDDSKMCVVYKSSQTMPEFVLTYRADEDNKGSSGGGGGSGGQQPDQIRQLFRLVQNRVSPAVYRRIHAHVRGVKEDQSLSNDEKRKKIIQGLIE